MFDKTESPFPVHTIKECSYLKEQGLAARYIKKGIPNQKNNSAGLKSCLTDVQLNGTFYFGTV